MFETFDNTILLNFEKSKFVLSQWSTMTYWRGVIKGQSSPKVRVLKRKSRFTSYKFGSRHRFPKESRVITPLPFHEDRQQPAKHKEQTTRRPLVSSENSWLFLKPCSIFDKTQWDQSIHKIWFQKSKIGDKSYLEINPDYDNIIMTGRVWENTEVGLSDLFTSPCVWILSQELFV